MPSFSRPPRRGFWIPASVALFGVKILVRPLLARVLRQIWAEDIGVSSKFDPNYAALPKTRVSPHRALSTIRLVSPRGEEFLSPRVHVARFFSFVCFLHALHASLQPCQLSLFLYFHEGVVSSRRQLGLSCGIQRASQWPLCCSSFGYCFARRAGPTVSDSS